MKSGGRVFFLRTQEIDWIEAAGNYVRLHLGDGSHLFRETMNNREGRPEVPPMADEHDGEKELAANRPTATNGQTNETPERRMPLRALQCTICASRQEPGSFVLLELVDWYCARAPGQRLAAHAPAFFGGVFNSYPLDQNVNRFCPAGSHACPAGCCAVHLRMMNHAWTPQ